MKNSIFVTGAYLCARCASLSGRLCISRQLQHKTTLPHRQTGEAVFAPLQEPAQNFTGCGGFTVPVVNSQYEARVFELVNVERTSRGIPPLKRVTLLDNAGRYHAKDMADDNYFNHDSYDRSGSNLVSACAWSTRITSFYSGWSSPG